MKDIRFLDLRVQSAERDYLRNIFEEVMNDGILVLGDQVVQFEQAIANFCGRRFAIGVSSGTDALFLALRALGVGKGDEVITSSLSWVATANAIKMTGATPVFADICEDLNIDPKSVEELIGKNTKAILFVNFTGRLAKVEELQEIASKTGLLLIEDASQSFGAVFKNRKSGSFGFVSAISHNPMKVFAALGEAGSVLTDDESLYSRMDNLRYNGTINRELCIEPSLNSRIDNLQARFLSYRLLHFMKEVDNRRRNALSYNKILEGIVKTPEQDRTENHVFYTYSILAAERDELARYLESQSIETKIQHKLPIPLQPAYLGSKGAWSRAERLCKEILCLPVHSKLSEGDINYVADSVVRFYSNK